MEQKHILIVEDEPTLGAMLKENLRLNGFSSKWCKNGLEGFDTFNTERFDLCMIDVNMPKLNGFDLAKLIREKNQTTPILFLTANSSKEDKIKGFEYGADEYITKPFDLDELLLRIKAILKRSKYAPVEVATKDEVQQVGSLTIDFTNQQIKHQEEMKRMSTTEAKLLKLFVQNQNSLIARNAILLHVWGRDDYYTARNLDVYINKLRKLLKPDESIEIINIHGSGFKFVQHQS